MLQRFRIVKNVKSFRYGSFKQFNSLLIWDFNKLQSLRFQEENIRSILLEESFGSLAEFLEFMQSKKNPSLSQAFVRNKKAICILCKLWKNIICGKEIGDKAYSSFLVNGSYLQSSITFVIIDWKEDCLFY